MAVALCMGIIQTTLPSVAGGLVQTSSSPGSIDLKQAQNSSVNQQRMAQAVASGVNPAAIAAASSTLQPNRAPTIRDGKSVDASFKGEQVPKRGQKTSPQSSVKRPNVGGRIDIEA